MFLHSCEQVFSMRHSSISSQVRSSPLEQLVKKPFPGKPVAYPKTNPKGQVHWYFPFTLVLVWEHDKLVQCVTFSAISPSGHWHSNPPTQEEKLLKLEVLLFAKLTNGIEANVRTRLEKYAFINVFTLGDIGCRQLESFGALTLVTTYGVFARMRASIFASFAFIYI